MDRPDRQGQNQTIHPRVYCMVHLFRMDFCWTRMENEAILLKMKEAKVQEKRNLRGTILLHCALALLLGVSTSLFTGCKRHSAAASAFASKRAKVGPEEAAILQQLTLELRRTMRRQSVTTFEEFAAFRSDLVIPPPPAGKKYVINKEDCYVDLVDQ